MIEPQCFETGKCRLCGRMTSRNVAENTYLCSKCEEKLPMDDYFDELLIH